MSVLSFSTLEFEINFHTNKMTHLTVTFWSRTDTLYGTYSIEDTHCTITFFYRGQTHRVSVYQEKNQLTVTP